MASPSNNKKTLSPLNTRWHNRSLSSVTSEAATFHFALPSVELKAIPSATTPRAQTQPAPSLELTKMSRQDSGYGGEDSNSTSRRTSTSSARHLKASKRSNFPSRPCHKRASRSTPTARAPRPAFRTRQTSPVIHAPTFFQFPVLADPEDDTSPHPPPPPVTCHYWTSDSTRRLEYAAIDAASSGVKGFFIKLVPDCILPSKVRRTRFHGEESDTGSVRRYRLELPEEMERGCEVKSGFRRWWRRGSA